MSPKHAPIASEIIDQAAEWFVTMREPSASEDTRTAFAEWLRLSPVHVRAYLEVSEMWVDAAHVRHDLVADPDPSLASTEDAPSNVVQLSGPSAPLSAGYSSRIGHARARSRALLAASVVLAFGLAVGFITKQILGAPTYSADVGEQRVITLEDGSLVRLNSRSSVRVQFSEPLREIDLLQGQALFQVAKDPARPFIVHSGRIAVRAVGTEFDVYRKTAGTVVTVVEGRVLVNTQASSSAPPPSTTPAAATDSPPAVPLSTGEQLTVTRTGAVEHKQHANVAAATSWLHQELSFDGQPLSEVVEEFNRYTRLTIVVSDPALAGVRINAVFHSTNPDSLLRFVRRFDGVEVEESGNEIRISRHAKE